MNCRYGGKEFNGSGLLIYRPELAGLGVPIPSVRLKAQRRGFQDYEYFWLLRQAGRGEDADRIVNGVVTGEPFGSRAVGRLDVWKHDPEEWEAARLEAGRLLHSLARR